MDAKLNPYDKEDAFFIKQEFERKQKIEAEKHKLMKAAEKKALKDLHHMRCPKCGMELIEIKFHDIAIDECSECRGVWLDAGELEQVMALKKNSLDKLFSIFKK